MIGKRIRLLAMPDDPAPLPVGTEGIVRSVTKLDGWSQLIVDWDNGSMLSLAVPPDQFEVL